SAALILHLRDLSRTPAGFDAEHLLSFGISIPGTIAADARTRVPFQRRLVEALHAIPGVEEVAFASQLALDGCCMGTNIYPEGRQADLNASQRMSLTAISPDYFLAMRIPLKSGRLLTDRDVVEHPAFAVISQAAATRYWGDLNPI